MNQTIEISRSPSRREAWDSFDAAVVLSEPFRGQPPLWIEPRDAALRSDIHAASKWMHDNRLAIEAALLSFGAIVWRGFPIASADDFAAMMGGFEPFSKGYVAGTSERKPIKGKVMESTRTPPEVYIFLHQEMSYQIYTPRLLAFHCRQPAPEGGETVIGDMRGVLEALPQDMQRRFTDDGVIYGRNFRDGTVEDWRADPVYRHHSWQHWFGSDAREDVSAQLEERGIEHEWLADGSLRYWTHRPGVVHHPATDQRLLFNQLHSQTQHRLCFGDAYIDLMDAAYGDATPRPYFVQFGDGKTATEAEFQTLHDEMERRRIRFDWRAGDVMLVENKLTSHGRLPFKGEREIQVMLFD